MVVEQGGGDPRDKGKGRFSAGIKHLVKENESLSCPHGFKGVLIGKLSW